MSPSPYPAPAVCIEPGLGAETTQALGRRPSERVAAHLAVCHACQLQRRAFDELDASAVQPPPELRARVRGRVVGPSPGGGGRRGGRAGS